MPLADQSFDIVMCQLGLQFMDDKPAALREMYRVLIPGGRVVISVTGPTPEPFSIFADALGRHINPRISPFVHLVFSLDDPEALRALLDDAGFSEVSVHTFTPKLQLPPPADFMWQYIYSTPMSEPVNQAGEDSRSRQSHDRGSECRRMAGGR
jgi:SAM-dependent methyltransferase